MLSILRNSFTSGSLWKQEDEFEAFSKAASSSSNWKLRVTHSWYDAWKGRPQTLYREPNTQDTYTRVLNWARESFYEGMLFGPSGYLSVAYAFVKDCFINPKVKTLKEAKGEIKNEQLKTEDYYHWRTLAEAMKAAPRVLKTKLNTLILGYQQDFRQLEDRILNELLPHEEGARPYLMDHFFNQEELFKEASQDETKAEKKAKLKEGLLALIGEIRARQGQVPGDLPHLNLDSFTPLQDFITNDRFKEAYTEFRSLKHRLVSQVLEEAQAAVFNREISFILTGIKPEICQLKSHKSCDTTWFRIHQYCLKEVFLPYREIFGRDLQLEEAQKAIELQITRAHNLSEDLTKILYEESGTDFKKLSEAYERTLQ